MGELPLSGEGCGEAKFCLQRVLDLTRDEQGNAVIEFDLVKVAVSFELLGLLYARSIRSSGGGRRLSGQQNTNIIERAN
jgi:hypothetical protein